VGAVTKTLYETDFVEWTERTAALLREGRFDEADVEHAAEGIETWAEASVRQLLRSYSGC
jgi:Domain of unknown function DUF29